MEDFLTITALAKSAGVSTKALRYWESLGLLPRAARTHTGYRVFPSGARAYVKFVQRSKDMGLTLQQMRTVLQLARTGRSPCPDVESWVDRKIADIESEIARLSDRLAALKLLRDGAADTYHDADPVKECCCLLLGLPEARPFQ